MKYVGVFSGTPIDLRQSNPPIVETTCTSEVSYECHLDRSAARIRPQFLKVPEVAELLGVKPRTIYEMVATERIPYRKPPGSSILRFDLDEILAWTKRRDDGSNTE